MPTTLRAFDPSTSARLAVRPGGVRRSPVRSYKSLIGDAIVFAIPASSAFSISVGGLLPYGEIILLVLLPYLLLTRQNKIFRKEYRSAYLLLALWIFSQTITDIYVGTSDLDRLKGVARVLFFAIDMAGLSALIDTNLRRIILFIFGVVTSGIFAWYLTSGTGFDIIWKMNFGPNLTMLLLLLASLLWKSSYTVVLPILLGMAFANLHYGVRSQVLIDLATALLLLPLFLKRTRGLVTQGAVRGGVQSSTMRPVRIAALLILGILAVWGSEKLIHWAVNANLYGEAEEAKFQAQDAGKLGMIFGGRPEGPVAIQAIRDSPFLGHGSYAVDPKYSVMLQDYQYELGYTASDDPEDLEDPGIPTHSHLTMAWVEGGFLASIFWFYMLVLCCRSVIRLTEISHPLKPVYVFAFIGLFWDILFSPYGYTRRLSEAFLVLLMVNLIKRIPEEKGRIGQRSTRPRPMRRPRILWRPAHGPVRP